MQPHCGTSSGTFFWTLSVLETSAADWKKPPEAHSLNPWWNFVLGCFWIRWAVETSWGERKYTQSEGHEASLSGHIVGRCVRAASGSLWRWKQGGENEHTRNRKHTRQTHCGTCFRNVWIIWRWKLGGERNLLEHLHICCVLVRTWCKAEIYVILKL